MTTICPHCGKEHATVDELEERAKRMKDVSAIGEPAGTTLIEVGHGPETDD
jgi:hypothetical protein